MNKIWLISIGVIVITGLVVFVFWFVGSGNQAPSNNNGQTVGLPVAGTATQPPSATLTQAMTVQGANGGSIQTTNFMSDPETAKDSINPGYYYLGYHPQEGVSDPTASSNPPYVIEYIAATQYFNIALLQEPIGTMRAEAEQYLTAHLGISKNQMCQLNYMVSVPNSVNSQYSGISLGFSFCPGAVALPQ